MPYCPKCRNKVNDGKRICPVCGAPMGSTIAARRTRAKKRARQRMITMACIVLALIAIVFAIIRLLRDKEPATIDPGTKPSQTTGAEQTDPQSTQTDPTHTTVTEPTQSDPAPTDPTPTDSAPTVPEPTDPPPTESEPVDPNGGELIGSLYTRAELEAMENDGQGYGPGKASDGNRPPYPDPLQNKYGKYGANFIAPDNGNIYLTFDCGYEYTATDENGNKYRVTEKILDVLKEKNVKAVFFVTMYYVKEQPDLVQRMIDEGHTVGNHSNNHPVMPDQTIDKMVYEVMSLHEYVKEHFGYEMNLFRFPTGEFSTRALAVVQTLGYKSVHWSFAYADYDTENQPDVEKALEKVTSSHHSGAIYLLHAISTTNASLLGDAIDFVRADGYNIELFQ